MEKYDIIHFEALGDEAAHLEAESIAAMRRGDLPASHRFLIVPDNVQQFLERCPDAVWPDIVTVKTHSVLPVEFSGGMRRSVITRSAGYDHLEHLSDRLNIASLREYCVNAVAQTAIKFLYAAAGKLNHYTANAVSFERKKSESFMELGAHKTLTVFGVGRIGKRICELAAANGLTVQGVDIRHAELGELYAGAVAFVSKEQALANSDIMVNAMNLTKSEHSRFYNVDYFARDYLSGAKKGLIFINVTRGEIAPESTLLELYNSGVIAGVGLDVFSRESEFAEYLKGGDAADVDLRAGLALVKMAVSCSGNIYVQPHQGFNSDLAARSKAVEAIRHVAVWYKRDRKGFDEQLPYYE
ncbi:MAG: NAD(P)-dependent oxidoreductase [Kiritimatiellae bacterium]|nr:NAD(P)-dependent oxidoreductase [Kiritimatiellia bacterium]